MRHRLKSALATITAIVLMSPAMAQPVQSPDDATIADAYVYLLGRALVDRQEKTDMAEAGVDYNVIKYNPVGAADFVNPNLDVAYLEAWIAVDDQNVVLLEVPKVEGRYYTVQICDEWGNVVTNINERDYPLNPYGTYAFVTPDTAAAIPEDAVPIVLPSRKAKMLARVELQTDVEGAVDLQRQFTMSTLGEPEISAPSSLPLFDNQSLVGLEIFDHSDELLSAALDSIPVAPKMQAKVRAVARAASDPTLRNALEAKIRDSIVPRFLQFAVTEAGSFQNNWLGVLVGGIYGDDYWIRTAANLVGIWANTTHEVIYFVATTDGNGKPLNGSSTYVIEFDEANRPNSVVNGYWSVILVDLPDYRVVPNAIDRFNFNSYSPLERGAQGGLSLFIAPAESDFPSSNWLPSTDGKPFSLTFRTYVPKEVVKAGNWFPPSIRKLN
ncbi:DUF1214 domain-containing protein [Tateyamaria sp.]|uniref:DUF1214 domain-containing protein n=1 Tax=Tateyamaria sp. TaxID=1929288 RepID=UPI0032A05933